MTWITLVALLQLAGSFPCGRVVAVSCDGPTGQVRFRISSDGGATTWFVIVAPELRSRFGARIQERYEQQLVCASAGVKPPGRVPVRITDPSQLTVKEPVTTVLFQPDAVRTCDPDVQQPVVIKEVRAPFTPDAMRAKVNGAVILQGVVGVDGSVSDVRVVQSLIAIQDEAAREALLQWKFRPALKNGQRVPIVITVEMAYTTR